MYGISDGWDSATHIAIKLQDANEIELEQVAKTICATEIDGGRKPCRGVLVSDLVEVLKVWRKENDNS